ncbi:MAG TPA: ATP-binding protein, partial [Candidatus Omnitrophota bacterium]|nr:ATP-binding protein [Candidatus Omnitrophota bacterium]
LARAASDLGVGLGPFAEGMPQGVAPIYVAEPSPDSVLTGLMPPFSGFVDSGADIHASRCLDAVGKGGICLSLTTAAAYAIDPTPMLGDIVRRRFGAPEPVAQLIELGLAEALGNAIIHGNLGIDSDMRATFDGFTQFSRLMAERLEDPVLASRRVEVTLVLDASEGLTVAVSDQGQGFDIQRELSKPVESGAKSGRGLALIRKMAKAVAGADSGRTLVMTFALAG